MPNYSDFVSSRIAANPYPVRQTCVAITCANCRGRLPGAPWSMPWFALAFCSTGCASAWENAQEANDESPL